MSDERPVGAEGTLRQRALNVWHHQEDEDGDTPSIVDWDTQKDAFTEGWVMGYRAALADTEPQPCRRVDADGVTCGCAEDHFVHDTDQPWTHTYVGEPA